MEETKVKCLCGEAHYESEVNYNGEGLPYCDDYTFEQENIADFDYNL